MSEDRDADGKPRPPPAGWVIAVLVELAGAREPVPHYFAIGHAERAKAEWTAVDWAQKAGDVAASPWRGEEPVKMLAGLVPASMAKLGLARGEVRELGVRWPRKWLVG